MAAIIAAAVLMMAVAVVNFSIQSGLPSDVTDPKERMRLLSEELKSRPGLQAISAAGSCVLPMIGVAAGIAAMARRAVPRWPAIVALSLAGAMVLLICAGFVVTTTMGAGV